MFNKTAKAIFFSETVRNNIKTVKKALNLTSQKIGEATGVAACTVTLMINGTRKANPEWPDRFCDAYHVDREWLYNGTGTPVFTEIANSVETRNADDAGLRIAEIRKSMKITQKRMAEELGISCQFLNRIENGKAGLTAHVAERFEDTYGIGSEWLLYGDESRKDYPVAKRMIDYLWQNEQERKRIWEKMTK